MELTRIEGVQPQANGQGERSVIYLVGASLARPGGAEAALRRAGHTVAVFTSSHDFLHIAEVVEAGCVVAEASGTVGETQEFLRQLKVRRAELPVLFTGCGGNDVDLAVSLIKSGAVDYVAQAGQSARLVDVVTKAQQRFHDANGRRQAIQKTRDRIADLSLRERDVLNGLLEGGTNKTIARGLGISPRTVEIHRSRLMEHLGARTLSHALSIAHAAGLTPSSLDR